MRNPYTEIQKLQAEQGWNSESLGNLAQGFIRARGLMPDFVQFLKDVAAEAAVAEDEDEA